MRPVVRASQWEAGGSPCSLVGRLGLKSDRRDLDTSRVAIQGTLDFYDSNDYTHVQIQIVQGQTCTERTGEQLRISAHFPIMS